MLATGSWMYSCTTSSAPMLPVFVTSTEAVTLPFAGIVSEPSWRLEIWNVV
jgi:hypothetical protein